jgi:hypothetical protein
MCRSEAENSGPEVDKATVDQDKKGSAAVVEIVSTEMILQVC